MLLFYSFAMNASVDLDAEMLNTLDVYGHCILSAALGTVGHMHAWRDI